MKTSLKWGVGAWFAAAVLAATGEARAAIHVEFSLSAVRKTPSFETTYVHHYVPPFAYTTVVRSSSDQTVSAKAEIPGIGFAFGAAVYLGEHLGLRFAMDSLEASILGETTPDLASVTYMAMQPPDYVSREYTVTAEGALPP